MEENKVNTFISDNKVGTWYSCQLKENCKHLSILIHFCCCFFFFCFVFLFVLFLSFIILKKKSLGQTLWGQIAATVSTKIQEAAIISVNICAQKEGIVPKTT